MMGEDFGAGDIEKTKVREMRLKLMKMFEEMTENLREFIRDYFTNSSMHGLRYIMNKKLHWTERWFWVVCVLLSWYGTYLVGMSSYDAFLNKSISFVVETTYTDWNTSFPSVTVCEFMNLERAARYAEKHYKDERDSNLDEIIREVAYFPGSQYYINEYCTGPKLGYQKEFTCPKNSLVDLANEVHSSCQETFDRCEWNNRLFDCCQYFLPVETEFGVCYSVNNLQTEPTKSPDRGVYPMVSNETTGPGTLKLKIKIPTKIYTHSNMDIPTENSPPSDIIITAVNMAYKRQFDLKDTQNEPAVQEVSVVQRKCQFPDENYLQLYRVYSYTACITECRQQAQLRMCNCSSHLMPGVDNDSACTITGLLCLQKHIAQNNKLENSWTNRGGLHCECMAGCTEVELNTMSNIIVGFLSDNTSEVELSLDHLPSERFIRYVVRGQLDLVVSMGSTAGLFVGASLLSFVELLYYLTVRIFNNISLRRNQRKQRLVEVVMIKPRYPIIVYI